MAIACVPTPAMQPGHDVGGLAKCEYLRTYGHSAALLRQLAGSWEEYLWGLNLGFDKPWYVKDMERLLENKLRLEGKGVVAGKGKYEFSFLCAEVEEDDLPWDGEAVDW